MSEDSGHYANTTLTCFESQNENDAKTCRILFSCYRRPMGARLSFCSVSRAVGDVWYGSSRFRLIRRPSSPVKPRHVRGRAPTGKGVKTSCHASCLL